MRAQLSERDIEDVKGDITGLFGDSRCLGPLLFVYQKAYDWNGGMPPEGLQGVFQSKRFLTEDNLGDLIRWKMSGRAQKLVSNVADRFQRDNYGRVEQVTREISEAIGRGSSPAVLIAITRKLQHVWISMGFTILAAWSDDFPVIDRRAWKALRLISNKPYFDSVFPRQDNSAFAAYVEILRDAGSRIGVSARKLDKALCILGGARP